VIPANITVAKLKR